MGGRPPSHLLSGLARCGQCGGPIAVHLGKWARHGVKVYCCQYHRNRGDEVCTSSLCRPVDEVNAALVEHLTENVLTEGVVANALKIVRRRLIDRTRTADAEVKPLEAEAKQLLTEIDNLVSAIAGRAEKPDAIVQAVAERQERLSALDARIRAIKRAPEAIATELRRLEREARTHLADLHATLRAHPVEARAFLARIFSGPLKFTPEGNRYRIEGEIPVANALFAGVPNSASPGGFEPLGAPMPFALVA